MRTVSDEEIRSLKGATDAAYTLGGGVTKFPLLTRVNVSTLSKYASFNEENEDFLIPVDVAIEADRRAKSPVILSTMAEILGFRLERARGAMIDDAPLSERDAHVVLSEAMDVSRELLAAFADGRIDALEKKRLRKELRELIRSAEKILDKLDGE